MSNLIRIDDTELQEITYHNVRVVTGRQIDELHGRPEETTGRTYRYHKDRFIEEKDYFRCNSSEADSIGVTLGKVKDERYGKINSYPESFLDTFFPTEGITS